MMYLYNFSGGMESAAMIWLCRDDIKLDNAIVRWADTGKQFPEMADSISQIENICGFKILKLAPQQSFNEWLFKNKHGILKRGIPRCSIEMKRWQLSAHAESLPIPQSIALGFNAKEIQRGEDFCARNNTSDRTYFFPLIERNITRKMSVQIVENAGFSILVEMYRKMGRFDCFFCPNQQIRQAEKVMVHYPTLWQEWKDIEEKKGHSILAISAKAIEGRGVQDDFIAALDKKQSCSCMGGE